MVYESTHQGHALVRIPLSKQHDYGNSCHELAILGLVKLVSFQNFDYSKFGLGKSCHDSNMPHHSYHI